MAAGIPDGDLLAMVEGSGVRAVYTVIPNLAIEIGESMTYVIPFSDDASIENAIHCIAVSLLMGMKPEVIAERLMSLSSISMRLEIKAGMNNCTIINDYYNSDVNSLSIALDVMKQQHQHKRKFVILSDILQS